jgi:hypothetical protein
MIERTLRMETPAHIYLKICWLSHCDMQSFETIYNAWLSILKLTGVKHKGEVINNLSFYDSDPTEQAKLSEHTARLKNLIDKLHNVDNVQPMAGLHDCLNPDTENPQITLNQMSLGTN